MFYPPLGICHCSIFLKTKEKDISGETGILKYAIPHLQSKNPMTLCLTRMRVHLERRTVAVRPRGRERQNPLPVVLLRCQRRFLSPSLSLAFVAENLRGVSTMEAAWRCLWHLRDYVFASRRYSRSLARLASSALVILSSRSHVWIFTEPKLRGEERRVQTSGAFGTQCVD